MWKIMQKMYISILIYVFSNFCFPIYLSVFFSSHTLS